jgi:hypothetical protein
LGVERLELAVRMRWAVDDERVMNNKEKKHKLSLLAETTAMCGAELLEIEGSRIARNRNTQNVSISTFCDLRMWSYSIEKLGVV